MSPFRSIGRGINLQCRSSKQVRSALNYPISIPHMASRNLASSHTQDDPEQVTSADAHGSHESHYDPPTGWLWGIPPGEKPEKEGWENTWVYGYWGSLLLGVVLYAYKPDTSIQTWALEEARRRLEKEGILQDPFPDGLDQGKQ